MKYISTRQVAPVLNFEDVVLQGLASDGGLYVPEFLPKFSPSDLKEMAKLNYQDLMYKITNLFIGDAIDEKNLKKIINESYKKFSHLAIAPIKQISHNEYLLELFHGPTLAFKDFALQFLGNLFDYILNKNNQDVVIIGATSGDTGSAAIMACKASKHVQIFILHPHNKISDIQRKQMTTVLDKNVYNIAVQGDFDDCQALVKKMFLDQDFLNGKKMVAVNSINWVRIMAQIIYYFYSGLRLGASTDHQVSFSVPTGNFGNIYAGYLAKKMGLPIKKLIIATNSNDILTRFIKQNDYSKKNLVNTLSPSMNIQVSSNFERLLFDVYRSKNNAEGLVKLMKNFEQNGSLKVDNDILEIIRGDFDSYVVDDENTCGIIKDVHDATGETIDPHSAVGVGAARKYMKDKSYSSEPIISLATAHPSKFPEAMEKSSIPIPPLPRSLSNLINKKERMEILPNEVGAVKDFVSRNCA